MQLKGCASTITVTLSIVVTVSIYHLASMIGAWQMRQL